MSTGDVNFHADVTSGHAPLTVHFTDDTPGFKSDRNWNFGDGGVRGEINPTYTYNNPGTYDVSLTIYNSSGVRGIETKQGYITVYSALPNSPVAEFRTNTTTGPAPLAVQFTGLASGGTLSYDWDFGDGTQHSGDQNPLHVYTNPNNYTVRLKVSNPGGIDFTEALIVVTQPVNQSLNNSTQLLTANLTPTPVPAAASSSVTPPRSIIPSINVPNFSLSDDRIQLILAALVALAIAAGIIYYFTSLSKRGEKNKSDKGPGSLMQKPRSPVKASQAPAARLPAKAPEAKKPQTTPVNPPVSAPKPVPKPAPKPAEAPVPKPVPKPAPKPAEAPAPKPSKKDTDVDKDYLYGLVMGKSQEPKKDNVKKK